MLFLLDDSIFTNGEASFEVLGLLSLVSTSHRHVVLVRQPDSEAYRGWLESLGASMRPRVAGLFDGFFRTSVQRVFGKSVVVLAVGASSKDVSLTDAIALAKRPFRLYVENSRNDRRFIFAACTEPQRERFQRMEATGDLAFVNGGGITELKKQVEQDVANSNALHDYSWAMFDSDSLTPGAPSSQSSRVKESCDKLQMKHHQLVRRSIENYLPKTTLKGWIYKDRRPNDVQRRRGRAFQALAQLPPTMAHHYNMKAGIGGDRQRADYPRGDTIYSGVASASVSDLEGGFGQDVSDAMQWGLSESELKADGSWVELQQMISDLETLI